MAQSSRQPVMQNTPRSTNKSQTNSRSKPLCAQLENKKKQQKGRQEKHRDFFYKGEKKHQTSHNVANNK